MACVLAGGHGRTCGGGAVRGRDERGVEWAGTGRQRGAGARGCSGAKSESGVRGEPSRGRPRCAVLNSRQLLTRRGAAGPLVS